MRDVQCYELFGGIVLKNHAFSFSITDISMIIHPNMADQEKYMHYVTSNNLNSYFIHYQIIIVRCLKAVYAKLYVTYSRLRTPGIHIYVRCIRFCL